MIESKYANPNFLWKKVVLNTTRSLFKPCAKVYNYNGHDPHRLELRSVIVMHRSLLFP